MGRVGFTTKPSSAVDKIAFLAFNKHIADELNKRLAEGRRIEHGSDEQEAIWKEAMEGSRHIVVNAVAGSGKTSTGVEYCLRSGAAINAMTYHALGFSACRRQFGNCVQVDQYKMYGIVDRLMPSVNKAAKGLVVMVAGLAKQYAASTRAEFEWIVDRHDVDLEHYEELVMRGVGPALDRAKDETATIDFDDMVWLPYVMGLAVNKYDVAITDEAQDLNKVQQWLAMAASDRHIVVGDKNQAIYGFRGADSDGMGRLAEYLRNTPRGMVEMPLNFTRRCPQSHVRLAKRLVPWIEALEGAVEGVVRVEASEDKAAGEMRPGDLVVCRTNAPLLSAAYRCIKRGIKAVVRGRDIGKGIVKLIDEVCRESGEANPMVNELLRGAEEVTAQAVTKLRLMPNGRGEMRAQSAQDRMECLHTVCSGGGVVDSHTARRAVESLFADFELDGSPKHAVVFGTQDEGIGGREGVGVKAGSDTASNGQEGQGGGIELRVYRGDEGENGVGVGRAGMQII